MEAKSSQAVKVQAVHVQGYSTAMAVMINGGAIRTSNDAVSHKDVPFWLWLIIQSIYGVK